MKVETSTSLTPRIIGLESQPFIRVHLEPASLHWQRDWDEAVQNVGAQVSYHPEDDTYVVPAAFPMELLTAFNGQIIDSQKFTK